MRLGVGSVFRGCTVSVEGSVGRGLSVEAVGKGSEAVGGRVGWAVGWVPWASGGMRLGIGDAHF